MQRISLSEDALSYSGGAPMLFALGMLTGAAWYFSSAFEPDVYVLVSIFLVLVGGAISIRRRESTARIAIVLLVLAGSASGALMGKIAVLTNTSKTVEGPLEPIWLEGWVTAVQSAERGQRLVLSVHAIDGVAPAQTPRRVRLTQVAELATEPGRFVRCWAALRPPPSPVLSADYAFDRQAWFSGLDAVGYVQGKCRGGVLGAPAEIAARPQLEVAKWRRQLAQYVDAAAGEKAGGFAAALASGDRSLMAASDQAALRRSGLAHLLAISGLHMGIVGGLVFFMVWRSLSLIEPIALRWTVKKTAAICALVACLAYLVISGASVSTQRAFIMAAVAFGAVIVDRAALSFRSLALALIGVITLAPWSVLTPGFQMSFAATAALIATYAVWQERLKLQPSGSRRGVKFWIKSLVVTSLVSSVATMPFAMFHFDRVAGLGLFANLLAMPVISLVSAPLAAAALLLVPFGLDHWALLAFGGTLEWVLMIAHMFADADPVDHIKMARMPSISLLLMTLSLVCLCLLQPERTRLAVATGIAVSALFIWVQSGDEQIHWAPSGDLFLEEKNGAVTRLDIHRGDGLSPLRFKDIEKSRPCSGSDPCVITFAETEIEIVVPREDGSTGSDRYPSLLIRRKAETDMGSAANEIRVHWEDVVNQNGVSLRRRGASFVPIHRSPCGRRTWRPCRNVPE